MTPGGWLSLLMGGGLSWVWLRLRPDSPVGGAGGAIFPVLIVIIILYFAMAWLGPVLDERLFLRHKARRLRLEREATPFLRDMERNLRKARRKLGDEDVRKLDGAFTSLRDALDGAEDAVTEDALEHAFTEAERLSVELLHKGRKSLFMDFTESIGGALLVALVLRLFVVEAFKIPSGSMIPTLAVGDHIFVNKFIYGLSIPMTDPPRKVLKWRDPAPGEVVVFIAPRPADNAGEDYIKRVVAVAGQKVALKDGVLIVDGKPHERTGGEPLEYEDAGGDFMPASHRTASHYLENTGGQKHSVLYETYGQHDWPAPGTMLGGLECDADGCTVKPGFVFCMGDNRDNSADGRRWGAVPLDNVKGCAMFVWMSVRPGPGGAASGIRWERLGHSID